MRIPYNKDFADTRLMLSYGGKFGVQSERQDKSAVGWSHIEKVEKHHSQKDYKTGFGGKERAHSVNTQIRIFPIISLGM